MRSNSDWQQHGLIVGRPALHFSLDDSQRKPELVLSDVISLSSAEGEQFFDLLQTNERVLGEMAKADAAMGRARMAAAVRLLIDYLLDEEFSQKQDKGEAQANILANQISDWAII